MSDHPHVRAALAYMGPGWELEHMTPGQIIVRRIGTGDYVYLPRAHLRPWNGHPLDVLLAQVRPDQSLFLPDLIEALGVPDTDQEVDSFASALRFRGWRQNATNRPEWWVTVRADVFWMLEPPHSIESFAFFGPTCRAAFGPEALRQMVEGPAQQGELASRSVKVRSENGGTYRRKIVEMPASRVLLLQGAA